MKTQKLSGFVALVIIGAFALAAVSANAAPILTAKKSPDKVIVNAGGSVTYTIIVTNTGDQDATNVTLTDMLDADMSLISATPNISSSSNGQLKWNLGTIAAGTSRVISLTLAVDTNLSGKVVALTGNRLLINGVIALGDNNVSAAAQSTIEGRELAVGGVGGPADELPVTGLNPAWLLLLLAPVGGWVGYRLWLRA